MTLTKQAMVTGGAHPLGIGIASARALVAQGFAVTVTGISQSEIEQTPKEAGITPAILDVTDNDAVERLIGGFERLDALINCAGTALPEREFTNDGFMHTINVNLNGTMRCCIAARPLLEKSGGAIINIASMYASFGSGGVPAYSASKGGIVQLTKSLAVAWGAHGIRVNAIAPGWIKTGMARSMWENPQLADSIALRTPMQRWGEPEECGDVIAFLCSHAARFVTGQVLAVDGGYLASG